MTIGAPSYSSAFPAPGSCFNAAAVAPSDTAALGYTTILLVAAVAGNVKVATVGGQTATVAIAAGIPLPLRVTKVFATGTTATGIAALY